MTDIRQPHHSLIWRDWRTWVFVVVMTLTLGLVSRLHRYTSAAALGQPLDFWSSYLRDLPIFAILNPIRFAVVWVIADRLRFDQGRSRTNVPIHVAAALLIANLHVLVQACYQATLGPFVGPPLREFEAGASLSARVTAHYFRLLSGFFQLNFLWYWAIVGVYYAFHYYSLSQERLLRAAQLETSLTVARLQALRSQLNPHFLFNTLNTTSVLALKGQREAVVDILGQLSRLLRVALDDKRPENIPLQEELEFVEGYLEIQRIRFADRLTVLRDIDPDARTALVPAMILEPIVDNAVKHGISQTTGPAIVVIEARRIGNSLRLQVRDSGPGFDVATSSRKEGIGLSNVAARLEQFFGRAHRMEYGRAPEGGASVTVSIPFCEAGGRLSAPLEHATP